MTDIERKALDLINAEIDYDPTANDAHEYKALCRAIEQHEAFRQEVSDAVEQADLLDIYGKAGAYLILQRFIIPAPKPDPLVEVAKSMGYYGDDAIDLAEEIRAALEARGLEIREKNDD